MKKEIILNHKIYKMLDKLGKFGTRYAGFIEENYNNKNNNNHEKGNKRSSKSN